MGKIRGKPPILAISMAAIGKSAMVTSMMTTTNERMKRMMMTTVGVVQRTTSRPTRRTKMKTTKTTMVDRTTTRILTTISECDTRSLQSFAPLMLLTFYPFVATVGIKITL